MIGECASFAQHLVAAGNEYAATNSAQQQPSNGRLPLYVAIKRVQLLRDDVVVSATPTVLGRTSSGTSGALPLRRSLGHGDASSAEAALLQRYAREADKAMFIGLSQLPHKSAANEIRVMR